jgi:DMSO/TMAO reductase YedYZ molybdopterin-dependent catalytic subunit
MRRILLAITALAFLGFSALAQDSTSGKAASGPSEVKIGGAVTAPFVVTAISLKGMPRKTLRVENEHSKTAQVYEGVLVEDLLRKAGAPLGAQLRGPAMATYVMVEAADDYHVVFSLAELDSGFQDSEILLADTMDGAPLTPDQGPFKLVAPHAKRPARWVKMVKSLTVVRAPVQ